MDIEDLIDRILPCIEKYADGRNEITRARRRVMVRFFDYCAVYAADVPLDPLMLAYELQHHFNLLTDGRERIEQEEVPERELLREIKKELNGAWQLLRSVVAMVPEEIGADDVVEVAPVAHEALQRLFDWETPGRLRAYLYACTGEMLTESLLNKERSLLLAAIRRCMQEMET